MVNTCYFLDAEIWMRGAADFLACAAGVAVFVVAEPFTVARIAGALLVVPSAILTLGDAIERSNQKPCTAE